VRDERKWVTMQDVADRAAVSKITVSRVLRKPGKVKSETRARVEAVIQELGYVPDEAACTLASRKSRIVGALVSTLAGSIFASTVDGLSSRLREDGYRLLLAATDYSADTESEIVGTMLGRRPDGMVMTSSQHTEATHVLLGGSGVPTVELWDLPKKPIGCAVGFSNTDAGYTMTRFLFEQGYKRVAFIGRMIDRDVRAHMRATGYAAAARDGGQAEVRLGPTISHDESGAKRGAEGLAYVLSRWPDTDAVFCSSDSVALGALSEALRRGLRVPQDIAVAGFGDFEYAGKFGLRLTTVRIPGHEIGERAAELILERTQNGVLPNTSIDLGFEIVRRATA